MPTVNHPSFYMDSGTEGGEASCETFTQEIAQFMVDHGYKMGVDVTTYVDNGGQHNEYFWGHRFERPLSFLYPIQVTDTI